MARKKSKSTSSKSNGAQVNVHEEEKKDDSGENHSTVANGAANGNQRPSNDTEQSSRNFNGESSSQVTADAKLEFDSSTAHIRGPSQPPTSSKLPSLLRLIVLDLPLLLIFAAYVGMVLIHQFHDDYWVPHLNLMRFIPDNRQWVDTTYYHRICDANDISTSSIEDLVIPLNASKDYSTNHMLKHGASMYQNVITSETAQELREFILNQNTKQQGFHVIENENRYSWGIDINMHPSIKNVFKEIAANKQMLDALQGIIGYDPAIIEFTAITSTFGAKEQFAHQDVVPTGSAAKFARTFIPSYSLFIPLQDTTSQMGATHVCPGTHLCSQGCEDFCPDGSIHVSGDGIWPRGWGALLNQQTTHRGMAHYDPYGGARVVLVATFAPRPQTRRLGHETRMIAQGGSYSLRWNMWGHTLSDFIHAETRMVEPIKTLRSLGIVPGNGWTLPSVLSMRIANTDTGYYEDDLDDLLEKGGVNFLPTSWQGSAESSSWQDFIFGTITTTERAVREIYLIAIGLHVVIFLISGAIRQVKKQPFRGDLVMKSIIRLVVIHFVIVSSAIYIMKVVADSNWARSIRAGKASRIRPAKFPPIELEPQTLPNLDDILISRYYDSAHLASYGNVLEVAHPGNAKWRRDIQYLSPKYHELPTSVQRQTVVFLDAKTRQIGRLLKPNSARQWIEIHDQEERWSTFHRELTMASNSFHRAMIKQLDSLRSDMMLSPWFGTAIHERIMPEYLDMWEQRILPTQKQKRTHSTGSTSWFVPRKNIIKPISTIIAMRRSSTLFKTDEPLSHVWLVEGELFEGMYQCKYNEWYRGRISRVYANEYLADMIYEDGESDPGLRRFCIRPFVSYKVGEEADLRLSEEDWVSGLITAVYDDGSYDFLSDDDDLYRTTAKKLRRAYPDFEVGSRVLGNYDEEGEFFPASITAVNADGTFNLMYDDGDTEVAVQFHNIRLPINTDE